MDTQKALRALRLFNEKADKLDTLPFTKQVFSAPIGFRLQINQEGARWSRQGPSAADIDAFGLTIRFFVQDNEPSSFRNLSKVYAFLVDAGLIDQTLVDSYEEARDQIKVLHQPIPQTPVIYEGHSYTPWEIFDTILYGKLSHSNEEKERLYSRWEAVPVIVPIMEHWFIRTLAALVKVIDLVRPLNERAIESLTDPARS